MKNLCVWCKNEFGVTDGVTANAVHVSDRIHCSQCGRPISSIGVDEEESIGLNKLRDEIHLMAVDKGWWNQYRRFGEIIALCHSELSEALEEYRNGCENVYYRNADGHISNERTEEFNKPEGIAIELADCIIRILDWCGFAGIDIEGAIRMKNEYNETRPYRHGGKVI